MHFEIQEIEFLIIAKPTKTNAKLIEILRKKKLLI